MKLSKILGLFIAVVAIMSMAIVFVACPPATTTTTTTTLAKNTLTGSDVLTKLSADPAADTITLGFNAKKAQTWYAAVGDTPWAMFFIAISESIATNGTTALECYDPNNTIKATGGNTKGITALIRACAGNTFTTATTYVGKDVFFEGGNIIVQVPPTAGSDKLGDWPEAKFLDGEKADATGSALYADMTVKGDLPTEFTFKLNTATTGSPKINLIATDKIAVVSTLKPTGWGGKGTAIVDAIPAGSKGTAVDGTNSAMTISAWLTLE
ncbi:MAG TPA: hypothetical protein PK771_02845 [Spirochaetota bacterium]|nr:hypothetical protein [Spirochaetota bacterium]